MISARKVNSRDTLNRICLQMFLLCYSEIMRKGITAEFALSENPEQNLKLLQDMIPLYLYGVLGKHEK